MVEDNVAAIGVLKDARKLLVDFGWGQRFFHSEDGFCAVGAIRHYDSSDVTPAKQLLRMAIHTDCISRWNDDPKRTKEQVLAAFDRAIAMAEEG